MKVLKIIAVVFAVLFLGSACIGILRSCQEEAKEPQSQTIVVEKNIYSIRYVGVVGGKEVEIPNSMKRGKRLPNTYISGGSVAIPDLIAGSDNDHDYEFKGWYKDKELTDPFSGYIGYGQKGNVTLYAKIIITGTWSDNYT